MHRTAVIASLFVLSFTPACERKNDDEPDTGSETEVATTDEQETEATDESSTGGETDGSSSSSSGDGSTQGEETTDDEATSTPLVLAFAGEAVQFNTAVAAGFDLTGTMSVVTDWPTSTTPWLALDRNGNGTIDDGGELFGSATVLASGELASNGFVALRELDANGDGRIDARDPQWGRLLVWSDVDSDRVSAADELQPAALRELVAIELAHVVDRRCDARGNCEVERASFVHRAGGRELHGAVVDVHLRLR